MKLISRQSIRLAVMCAVIPALLPAASGAASVLDASVPEEASARSDLVLISSLDARAELLSVGGSDEASVESGHDPSKMFLISLAVPGSGELVQGKKRGYLFLLAEVAMWSGFLVLDKQGIDERGDYESFADANWDLESYMEFYNENCIESPHDYANGCRPLADFGSQEFYEDIGKYDVYWPWWGGDGVPNEPTSDALALRDEYWGMRKDSNTSLRQARYFMMAALLNHVVSAVDSFILARGNETLKHTAAADIGLEFGVPDDAVGLSVAFVATY
ncbi:hypothetical protein H8D73_00685 [bacterium]|nr:hypothetical protein [bacterium]